jgi:predicted site-specific integrase-resolvase
LQQKQAVICSRRVSISKQQDDLARQVAFMQEKQPQAEIVKLDVQIRKYYYGSLVLIPMDLR